MARLRLGTLLILILFVILSGCLFELDESLRADCIYLTSFPETMIPECSDIEKCFNEVEEFLDFELSDFSLESRQKFLSFKNHVAKSWLYYNKSKKSLEEINKACDKFEDVSSLEEKVYRLNFELANAFRESQKSMQALFALTALEVNDLNKFGVQEIMEEDLFDDFSFLNLNLNELKTPVIEESESFVSLYFQELKEFDAKITGSGENVFYSLEYSHLELLDFYDDFFYDFAPKEPTFFADIFPVVKGLTSKFALADSVTQAVSDLKKFPPTILFEAFNGLTGKQASVVKEFSLSQQKMVESIKAVKEKEVLLFEENIELIESIKKGLELVKETGLMEVNKELFLVIAGEKSLNQNNLNNVNLLDLEIEELKLSALEQEVLLVKEKDFALRLAKQKNLNSELKLLDSKIEGINSEYSEAVLGYCEEKSIEVNGLLKEKQEAINLNKELQSLETLIKLKLSYFDERKEKKEKISSCKSFVSNFEKLKAGLIDFEKVSLENQIDLSECVENLEKVFAYSDWAEVKSFENEFYLLKSLIKLNEDKLLAGSECKELEERIWQAVESKSEVIELREEFFEAKKFLGQLELLFDSFGTGSKSRLESLIKDESALQEVFNDEINDKIELLKEFESVELKTKKFYFDSKEELIKVLSEVIESNVKLIFLGIDLVKANEFFSSELMIVIENPLSEGFNGLNLSLLVKAVGVKVESSSTAINYSFFKDNELELSFGFLPPGETIIMASIQDLMIEASEIEELKFLTLEKAFKEKTIKIKDKAVEFSRLEIETELDEGFELESIKVVRENKTNYYVENDKLVIVSEKVLENEEIKVFYSVSNPIEFSLSLLNYSELGENFFEYSYFLKFKNNLDSEINKVSVLIPFSFSSNDVEGLTVFNEFGVETSASLLKDNKLNLELKNILPGQESTYFLNLIVKDLNLFWLNEFKDLKEDLLVLKESKIEEIKVKASELFSELTLIELEFDYGNRDQVTLVSNVRLESEKLWAELERLEGLEESYFFEKNDLLEKINELESELEKLKENNFDSEASQAEEDLNSLSKLIFEADLLKEEGKRTEALEKLENAKKLLLERNNLNSVTIEEINSLSVEVNELLAEIEVMDGKDIQEKRKELTELLIELNESQDSVIVKALISKIKEKKNKLELTASQQAEIETKIFKEKLTEFESMLSGKKTTNLISLLEEILASASLEELTQLNYFPPTSLERLKEIRNQLEIITGNGLTDSINSFNNLIREGKYFNALKEQKLIAEDFESKKFQLESIETEINDDYNQLESEALAFYNQAIEAFNANGQENKEITVLLEEANTAIQEKQLLQAVLKAKKVLQLLEGEEDSNIYYGFIPLAIAIASGGFYFKLRRSRQKTVKRKMKVMRNI
ncbi:MAG: hypothetical protein ABH821_02235 [archaeon]